MTASPELVAAFPAFGLRVRTPRLELRLPTDDELVALMAAARSGVHPADEMPFGVAWTDDLGAPDGLSRSLRYHWAARGAIEPAEWGLHLAAFVGGEPVGAQSLTARQFAVFRTVDTGSWLAASHQRRGLGTEMRAAVLHLAFVGLRARVATSGALLDNRASLRVSEKLGYEPNGEDELAPRGVARRHRRLRLSRERWEQGRRDDIELDGVEACLALLGAAAP